MRLVASVLAASAFLADATFAQPVTRPIVFVADIQAATPAVTQDAAAVTTSLCGLLAKDPRVEVLCAPDVKQIMSFAAMGSLTGAPSPAVEVLEKRLAAVKFVVSGTVVQKDDAWILVVSSGAASAQADATTPAFETAVVRLEETAKGKSSRLLERLPEMTVRLLKPLLTPTTPAPSTSAATLPPAPLKP